MFLAGWALHRANTEAWRLRGFLPSLIFGSRFPPRFLVLVSRFAPSKSINLTSFISKQFPTHTRTHFSNIFQHSQHFLTFSLIFPHFLRHFSQPFFPAEGITEFLGVGSEQRTCALRAGPEGARVRATLALCLGGLALLWLTSLTDRGQAGLFALTHPGFASEGPLLSILWVATYRYKLLYRVQSENASTGGLGRYQLCRCATM